MSSSPRQCSHSAVANWRCSRTRPSAARRSAAGACGCPTRDSLPGVLPRIVHALKRRGHRKPIQCRVLLDAALPAEPNTWGMCSAGAPVARRAARSGTIRLAAWLSGRTGDATAQSSWRSYAHPAPARRILFSRFRVPLIVVGPLAGAPVAGGVHHLVRLAGAQKALERGQGGAHRLLRPPAPR